MAWHSIASHNACSNPSALSRLQIALPCPVLSCATHGFQEVDQPTLPAIILTQVVSSASQSRVPSSNQPTDHSNPLLLHKPGRKRLHPPVVPLSPCLPTSPLISLDLMSSPVRQDFPLWNLTHGPKTLPVMLHVRLDRYVSTLPNTRQQSDHVSICQSEDQSLCKDNECRMSRYQCSLPVTRSLPFKNHISITPVVAPNPQEEENTRTPSNCKSPNAINGNVK
jgi:hypothetical protein